MPALQHHVQRMLMNDFDMSYAQAEYDEDGDIGFVTPEGTEIWVSIKIPHGRPWLRMWSTVAVGLKRQARLLREINELNNAECGVTTYLQDDGMLVAFSDVLAASIEPNELRVLADGLERVSERIGRLVQIVYGGGSASLTVEENR